MPERISRFWLYVFVIMYFEFWVNELAFISSFLLAKILKQYLFSAAVYAISNHPVVQVLIVGYVVKVHKKEKLITFEGNMQNLQKN